MTIVIGKFEPRQK